MAKIQSQHSYFEIIIEKQYSQYQNLIKKYDAFILDSQSGAADHMEKYAAFLPSFEELVGTKLSLVLIAASYIESIINFFYSHKLTAEQFNALDNAKLLDKWTGLLEIVVPGYQLNKSEELYSNLTTLINARNSITHMKPKITDGDKIKQTGNISKHFKDDQTDRVLFEKWVQLPKALLKKLWEADKSSSGRVTAFFSLRKIESQKELMSYINSTE